jgi:hypothetical protein
MTGLSSRRTFIATTVGGVVTLAGCTGSENDAREDAREGVDETDTPDSENGDDTGTSDDTGDGGETTATRDQSTIEESETGDVSLPVRDHVIPLSYDLGELEADAENGGVQKDGIPSIDDPTIEDASAGDDMMDPGDPVFGVELDGHARGYPQHVLVHHEVANDKINGRKVAVTYCPLTGTAQGFDRGNVELGVSGWLVNSNLIMYDRETDSWWPQMVASSALGRLKGKSLQEFRVIWTTWERWKAAHPDTTVLTEDTGHVRNYDHDPYGEYNPSSRYYADGKILFSPRFEDDSFHPKEVFIGARGADGAVAFRKDTLREDHLLEATVGDVPYLAVYHEPLDTAWVYRNPDGKSFEETADGYQGSDGTVHSADELPLESMNAFDTMWFPWYGYFPETVVVS